METHKIGDLNCPMKKRLLDSKVGEFIITDMLQDFQPDKQRYEIEEVARVIVTAYSVEVYTFDDKVHVIQFRGTTIKQMSLEEDDNGERGNPDNPTENSDTKTSELPVQ